MLVILPPPGRVPAASFLDLLGYTKAPPMGSGGASNG
jgi:hypothetical protein